MIRLSKLTDYGMMVMVCLGYNAHRLMSAREIAELVTPNMPTVSKVLKRLVTGGLVRSVRGVAGGYQLATAADQIRLSQIIEVLEGVPTITECSDGSVTCHHHQDCLQRENWQVINRMILQTFENITLAQMMRPMNEQTLELKGIPVAVEAKYAAA